MRSKKLQAECEATVGGEIAEQHNWTAAMVKLKLLFSKMSTRSKKLETGEMRGEGNISARARRGKGKAREGRNSGSDPPTSPLLLLRESPPYQQPHHFLFGPCYNRNCCNSHSNCIDFPT
jgi:hypothetical protein